MVIWLFLNIANLDILNPLLMIDKDFYFLLFPHSSYTVK